MFEERHVKASFGRYSTNEGAVDIKYELVTDGNLHANYCVQPLDTQYTQCIFVNEQRGLAVLSPQA